MRKLNLNKLSIASLNEIKHIRGGGDLTENNSTKPNCDPTVTDTKTLEDPDLPKTGNG